MDVLQKTLDNITALDAAAMRAAEERLDTLTMPHRALGRICDLAVRLSGITGRMPPPLERRLVVVMAGDHGVVAEGVTCNPPSVTGQMVANFIAGGAGVNVLARLNRAEVVVADFGMAERDEGRVAAGDLLDYNVGKGVANIARGPAMTRDDAIRAVENGIGLAKRMTDIDVFVTGEMGIGNTTPAAAIACAFTGKSPELLTGPGAGLGVSGLAHKIRVVQTALEVNAPNPADGIDVLAKVGGFEIGGLAGLILGAASLRKPVIVDGFISSAAAMVAQTLCRDVKTYIILGHAGAEPGHAAVCEWLGQKPLLELGLRLGEGSGAVMALPILDAASRILSEMATFTHAGVDRPEK